MLVDKAFYGLYGKEPRYHSSLKYSGKFNSYNGNVELRGNRLTVSLSSDWKEVNDDIKTGMIQVLLNKLFKTKRRTMNIELYESFLKNAHLGVKKEQSDPVLEESFNRVNEKYLNGIIDMPNLRWGKRTKRKLGSYDYGNDLITISSVLKEGTREMLDLVMYHEVLHKKHKFSSSGNKNYFHTKQFKEEERRFEDYHNADKRLRQFLRKKPINIILESLRL